MKNPNLKTIKVLGPDGKEHAHPLIDEKEMRRRIMAEANFKGCAVEMQMIFNKFDNLLKGCTNKQEAEAIGTMGVLEISELLDSKNVGVGGSLTVNGKTLIK